MVGRNPEALAEAQEVVALSRLLSLLLLLKLNRSRITMLRVARDLILRKVGEEPPPGNQDNEGCRLSLAPSSR